MNMEKNWKLSKDYFFKGTRLGQFYACYKNFKEQEFWILFKLSQGIEKDIESVPRYILKELHIKTPDKDSRKNHTHRINNTKF